MRLTGTGDFVCSDNAANHFQCWIPDHDCKAVVIVAHGLADHSGRYAELAQALVAAGYGVYAIDHIGHGKSQGQRAHVMSPV